MSNVKGKAFRSWEDFDFIHTKFTEAIDILFHVRAEENGPLSTETKEKVSRWLSCVDTWENDSTE